MARSKQSCLVEGCLRTDYATKNLCYLHYKRWKRHGDTSYTSREYHGLSHTPEYRIWQLMIDRVSNEHNKRYDRYGGRGITVCQRWRDSFTAFYDDVAPRPKGLNLDRKNNDGHYSCGKCEECLANGWPKNWRWATHSMQTINQGLRKCNTSGISGVSLHKKSGTWYAAIQRNHKKFILGYFRELSDAISARRTAEKAY